MKKKAVSTIQQQIMKLFGYLNNPTGQADIYLPLIFTDAVIREALGSEWVKYEGKEHEQCLWRLEKKESRTWAALLQAILPHMQKNFPIFEGFVRLSPFEGSAVVPFIEGQTEREFDFSHLKRLLNQSVEAKGHGVVLVTSGVAIIDPPKKRDLHALELLGSG